MENQDALGQGAASGRATAHEAFAGLTIASWLDGIGCAVLTANDGVALNVFHAGAREKPALLLINPIGVSMLLLSPLMRFLSEDYFVVSWETRGLPSLNAAHESISLTVDDHVRDVECVLEHFGVASADIVAFCSGTSIALPLLAGAKTGASRAVLISPSVLIDGEVKMTNYQRTVIPIWHEVMSKGKDYCAIISNFMRAGRPQAGDIDAEIDYVNRLPFANAQSTHKYAQLHAHVNESRHAQIFAELSVPVLLVHAQDDELIHVDVSRFIEGRLQRKKHYVLEQGGHFAICKNAELHRAIRSYLADPEGTQNVGTLA
jgi:3-oxoadipate enol-lactonase